MEKLLKKINLKVLLFEFFLFLAFLTRFYQLGNIPSSMNRDEPAIGYNAYSILKTNRDEWGTKFPLSFKSFGDYKSPLYIYLTVLPIKLFGLNEFSIRFWAALTGSLMVLAVYLLVKELLRSSKSSRFNTLTPIIVSFLLAISPWVIFYSRFSFEAILALFFNILILYILLINEFKKINIKIIILLILTFFTYSSSFIIWPMFFTVWFLSLTVKFIFKKNLNQSKKLFFALILIIVFSLVFLIDQISFGKQKGRITILGTPQLRLDFNKLRTNIEKQNYLKAKLFYNQYIYYGLIFLKNSAKSFSYNFLFGKGGSHPWHKIPNIPHFYPIFSILILIGGVYFLRNKSINKKSKLFIILFIFLSIVPSGITIDAPHATRLLNLFLWLIVFSGFGLEWLVKKFKFASLIIFLILVFDFLQFSQAYFINYKKNPGKELLPGLKEVVLYLNNHNLKEDRIIFDSHNDGAYIYLLFYSSYSPKKFLSQVKRYSPDTVGFEWVESFGKFLFVENPQPDNKWKEVYILKGNSNLGSRKIKKITSKYKNDVYYSINANF